jgi:hypothetical protein
MQPIDPHGMFRRRHILLQLAVFCGWLLPFGEVILPWMAGKLLARKTPALRLMVRRLLAFQLSWCLYRVILILVIGMVWVGPMLRAAERERTHQQKIIEETYPELRRDNTEEGFSIPGEPEAAPPPEPPPPLEETRELQDLMKLMRSQNVIFKLVEQFARNQMAFAVSLLCLALAVGAWLFSSAVTFLNIFIIARDGRPWYPLLLQWLKPKPGLPNNGLENETEAKIEG